MKLWFKKTEVPVSNETEIVDTVQLWEVRWYSRNGVYSQDTKPEIECFINEEDAKKFAQSLRNAFKLIRHTSGTKVEVVKGKYC